MDKHSSINFDTKILSECHIFPVLESLFSDGSFAMTSILSILEGY